MKQMQFIVFIVLLFGVTCLFAKTNNRNVVIDNVVDIKEFKKLLRTKTNVLICFVNSQKKSAGIIKTFKEAAQVVKGQGTMVLIDCSGEAKKLCKKLKVSSVSHILKHYKDGEFHKDYDRRDAVSSIVNFMRDPTGDLPWEEDPDANNVVHISDAQTLAKFIKKESKPLMVMFYAPWCGFCKTMKPDYVAAANELLGESVLAAIDVNRPENAVVRTQYNITGFPTLLFYQNGNLKFQYEGENNKKAIMNFMRNPHPPAVKKKEPEWSETDSDVVHLTDENFETVISQEASALVMFYAPWCGHCKRMKPEYEKAASILKTELQSGMLAAVDATKDQPLASKFSVKGYPTLKYFVYGEFKFDLNIREADKIVEFMRNPREAPPPPPPEKPWSEELSAIIHLTEDDFKPFLKKKKHVLVMFYAPWCGHCKRAKPEFSAAANKFKDDPKVEFAAVDCTIHANLCKINGVTGYPTLVYYNYYKTSKPYNGQRTEPDFVKFMLDPEEGSSSAKVANDWAKGDDVINLTDNSFKEVISKKEPTLVMFYAPWCGHCKTMKPDYIKAAEELKAEGFKGTLAMLDCTENVNTADEYEIAGFPTLKLFKSGKFIKDFASQRVKDELKRFVKEATAEKSEL